jgi:hypothetical protein
MLPFVVTFVLYYFVPIFLNSFNQMQFPQFVPKFDPIGIDLRWLWQVVQDWGQSGFSSLNNGAMHFPPFILLLFSWSSKLGFQDTYKLFSLFTLTLYLLTAIAIPYLVASKSKLETKTWLISIPFALLGLNAYGFQFEIERGQWNLVACCFAIWGCYLFWQGSLICRSVAIVMLTLAIQLKIYPAIFIISFFACRKNFSDGIVTCFAILSLNIALLFVFGLNGFMIFLDSVSVLTESNSYGIAQTSLSAFLWLVSQNHIEYLPFFKFLLLIYFLYISFTIYLLLFKKAMNQEVFISLIILLTTIGLIVPSHGNDYKLSLVPLMLSIMSPQLVLLSRLSGRYKKIIPLVALMLFFGISTFYSYATKPSSIFIQNNVVNLIVMSIMQCTLVIFVFNNELVKYSKKIIVVTAASALFFALVILAYQRMLAPDEITTFDGVVSSEQMKQISLNVKIKKSEKDTLFAVVIATNHSSEIFNTVNTSGLPVRLSWRFIKISETGERFSETEWSARKDLEWTITPGGSNKVEISSVLPSLSGQYLFEVTIVQDLVSFFHNAGMRVGSAKVVVEDNG